MGNLTTALVFVMALNVFMYLAQASILELNPDSAVLFFSGEGHLITEFDKNLGAGEPVLDTESTYDNLPSPAKDVSPTTGNIFSDMFTSIKDWFAQSSGLRYLAGIVSAPYNMLKAMGLPNSFTFAIGTLWYGITLFLIIAFTLGRDA